MRRERGRDVRTPSAACRRIVMDDNEDSALTLATLLEFEGAQVLRVIGELLAR